MKILKITIVSFLVGLSEARLRAKHRQLVGQVTGFRLIDAGSDGPVAEYDPLEDGSVIYLNGDTPNLSVEAITTGSVGSVQFAFDEDSDHRIENYFPYALCGDKEGDFASCSSLKRGSHTVAATPFSESKASGDEGSTITISFSINPGYAPKITGFKLIYTPSGDEIMDLNDGDVVDISALGLPSDDLNVMAVTVGDVDFISFNNGRTERKAPFAYCGDSKDDFLTCHDIKIGDTITITATPYSQGNALTSYTASFSIVSGPAISTVSPTTIPAVSTPTPTTTPAVSTPGPTTLPAVSTASPTTSPAVSTVSPTTTPAVFTDSPTKSPTDSPTKSPINSLTKSPTIRPTTSPTISPTKSPTISLTKSPTASPTTTPAVSTANPAMSPTASPTKSPEVTTASPTKSTTASPTKSPTASPTMSPVLTTASPTKSPTANPTKTPTASPTKSPVFITPSPTKSPTASPTKSPTASPTNSPVAATATPTKSPTISPTKSPTASPTASPVATPTQESDWTVVNTNAPIEERHEACFVMVENAAVGRRGYLVGGRGQKRTDIYDIVNKSWSVGAKPPQVLHHMQCVAAQGKLYVLGAWTGSFPEEDNAKQWVYDPATDSWGELAPMLAGRERGSAASIVSSDEKKIYVSHGNNGGHEKANFAISLGYLDVYDIQSNTWTALSDNAPNPRDHTGGALVNGRICVSGGRNGGEINWPSVAPTDCYNLSSGTWSVEAPIPNPRAGSAYGTSCDGNLIVAGGEGDGKTWDNVEVFNGSSWSSLPSLNVARHGTGLAIDCKSNPNEIHIVSGNATPGGGNEIKHHERLLIS